jgi:protein TonB
VRASELGQQVDIGPRSWLTALALVSVAHAVAVGWISTHRVTNVPPATTLVMEAALRAPLDVPAAGLRAPDDQAAATEADDDPPADEISLAAAAPEAEVPPEPDSASAPEPISAPAPADLQPPDSPAVESPPVQRISEPKAAPMTASTPRTKPTKVRAERARRTDGRGAAGGAEGGAAPAAVVTGPRHDAAYLTNPPPRYPAAARRQNMQGKVLIYAVVSPAGNCARAEVRKTSGHPILDEAALQAVRSWRFVPASRDGQPVAAGVEIPIVFRLED